MQLQLGNLGLDVFVDRGDKLAILGQTGARLNLALHVMDIVRTQSMGTTLLQMLDDAVGPHGVTALTTHGQLNLGCIMKIHRH